MGETTASPASGGTAQTYIVAQNPLVLAHLLRENQARALHPQAYTTPASVFNTVSVDFAETLPETHEIVEKIIHPKPDEKIDIPLQTAPIPAASLQKLDPIVPAPTPSDPPDETLTVVVGARESCDNLCQNMSSMSPHGDSAPPAAGSPEAGEPYASRVRSLERSPRGLAERAPARVGSLERAPRASVTQRASPVPLPPFTRQHSVPASPPPRARRDQDVGQFAVQGALNAQLAASVMNKMRTQPEPALVEEIYDFGGDNVKSCVAVAAQRAMARPVYRRDGMAASHPAAYGAGPGPVMPAAAFAPPPRTAKAQPGFLRSASPQPYPGQAQGFAPQPMGVVPPLSYGGQQVFTHNVVSGAQPMMYRAAMGSSQPSMPAFRPVMQTADTTAVYAARMECQPAVASGVCPVVPGVSPTPAGPAPAPAVVPVQGAVQGVSAGVSHVHGVAQPVQVTGTIVRVDFVHLGGMIQLCY